MSQYTSEDGQQITILYEVVPENPQEVDPAEMQAVADAVVAALKREGYTVKPVPTGTRGGLLFLIQSSVQLAITHEDQIVAALNAIKPVLDRFLLWQKQRTEKQLTEGAQGAIEVSASFGDTADSFSFKTQGSAGEEQFRYAWDQFLAHSQHVKALPAPPQIVEGTVTIREHVPARPRRRKR